MNIKKLKRNTKSKLIGIIAPLAAALALVPTNPVAAEAPGPTAVVSLAELKGQLTALQGGISAAVGALNQVKESAADPAALKKAAAAFNDRFQALEGQVETVRNEAVVVKARAKEHYESWQKDLAAVQNTGIREKAQDRFTDSKEQFEKIIKKAQRAKEEAVPFVSDLKDITIFLSADLTEESVKSLSNTIWKLGNRSKSVNDSIGDVTEQIDRTLKSLPQK